jgi:hypothetical protein
MLWGNQLVTATPERVEVRTWTASDPNASGARVWRVDDRHVAWATLLQMRLWEPGSAGTVPTVLPAKVFQGTVRAAAPGGWLLTEDPHPIPPNPPGLTWFHPVPPETVRVQWEYVGLEQWFGGLGRSLKAVASVDSGDAFFLTEDRALLHVPRQGPARAVTPASGLPVTSASLMATWGPFLVLADAARVAVWDTRIPLVPPALESLREWPLRGPCIQDDKGDLRAFLADLPGCVSRYDGREWTHVPCDAPGPNLSEMTADDMGRLQVAHPRGSLVLQGDKVMRFENSADEAWIECIRTGSSRFCNGTTTMPWHWTNRPGLAWFGGKLCDAESGWGSDSMRLPGSLGWVDPDGAWYRFGDGQTAVCRGGRWRPAANLPALMVGADGVCSAGSQANGTDGADWLPAVLSAGQYRAVDHCSLPGAGCRIPPERVGVPLAEGLAYRSDPSGGGWLGCRRVFRGIIREVPGISSVLVTPQERFVVTVDRVLRRSPARRLTVKAVAAAGRPGSFRVSCRYADGGTPARACFSMLSGGRLLAIPGDCTDRDSPQLAAEVPADLPAGSVVEFHAVAADGSVSAEPFRLVWRPAAKEAGPKAQDVSVAAVPPERPSPQPPQGPPGLPPLEFAPATDLPQEYGDLASAAPAPLWRVLPSVVGPGGGPGSETRLDEAVLADSDGRVWLSLRNDRREPTPFLVWDPAAHGWLRVFMPPGASAPAVSPAGRLHTTVASPAFPLERFLFELRGREWHLVTTISSESGTSGLPQPILWDAAGRLWNWGRRWLGWWDGSQWHEWETSIGLRPGPRAFPDHGGVVLPGPSGVLVATGDAPPWRLTTDPLIELASDVACVPLAGDCLLAMGTKRQTPGGPSAEGWLCLQLGQAPLDGPVLAARHSTVVTPDGHGNALVWGRQMRVSIRLDGRTFRREHMTPLCPVPAWPRHHDSLTAAVTSRGRLFLQPDPGQEPPLTVPSLITWDEHQGAIPWGPADGIPRGELRAFAEEPSGRIWLLRWNDVLVYTPEGTVAPRDDQGQGSPGGGQGTQPEKVAKVAATSSFEEAYPDWTRIACKFALDGVAGDVWYLTQDELGWTDGWSQRTWRWRFPAPTGRDILKSVDIPFTSEAGAVVCLHADYGGNRWYVAWFVPPQSSPRRKQDRGPTARQFPLNDGGPLTPEGPAQKTAGGAGLLLERVDTPGDGAVRLAEEGARRFSSWDAPPVATADGRVYCSGRLWTGEHWLPLGPGRPTLDTEGRIHILGPALGSYGVGGHGVFEEAGEALLPTGQARACRIDLHGRGWCRETDGTGVLPDQEYVLATPVRGSKVLISLAGSTGAGMLIDCPDSDGPTSAGPISPGRFWVLGRSGLWVLSANRLTPAHFSCPMPATWRRPVRLLDGRWALLARQGDAVWIAPPGSDVREVP